MVSALDASMCNTYNCLFINKLNVDKLETITKGLI